MAPATIFAFTGPISSGILEQGIHLFVEQMVCGRCGGRVRLLAGVWKWWAALQGCAAVLASPRSSGSSAAG